MKGELQWEQVQGKVRARGRMSGVCWRGVLDRCRLDNQTRRGSGVILPTMAVNLRAVRSIVRMANAARIMVRMQTLNIQPAATSPSSTEQRYVKPGEEGQVSVNALGITE